MSPTLLAIDIGNTNLHLGLWQANQWRLSWRARTVADKMADEYGVLVRNFLESAEVRREAIDGVVIACVVPRLTLAFEELVQRYFKRAPLFVSSKVDIGLKIDIDQPEQAGADRLANAAAVVALHGGGPCIVVDFGTATNFDVVTADNRYIGGALAARRACTRWSFSRPPAPSGAIPSTPCRAASSGATWAWWKGWWPAPARPWTPPMPS